MVKHDVVYAQGLSLTYQTLMSVTISYSTLLVE